MKIELTDGEMAMIQVLGTMRYYANVLHRTKSIKYTQREELDIDIDGVMGEYAFGKWKNVFCDWSIGTSNGGYDMLIPRKNGGMARVDVKVRRRVDSDLLVVLKENNDVDIYVLGIAGKNSVDFVGWAFKKDVIKEENKTDLGRGLCYLYKRSLLNQFTNN